MMIPRRPFLALAAALGAATAVAAAVAVIRRQKTPAAAPEAPKEDLYALLGVPSTASAAELRRGFRKCALRWHPDRVPAAEREAATRRFEAAAEAYRTLSDPAQRAAYDQGAVAQPQPAGAEESTLAVAASVTGAVGTLWRAMLWYGGARMSAHELPAHPKSAADAAFLRRALGDSALFRHLPGEQLDALVRAFRAVPAAAGDVVVRAGEEGHDFFVVGAGGECHVFEGGRYARARGAGEAFGDTALLYDRPSVSTVRQVAPGGCTLWALDKQSFRWVNKHHAHHAHQHQSFLEHGCPLLHSLTPLELLQLEDALEEKRFAHGDVVLREGERPAADDGFYIVAKGAVAVWKDGRFLRELGVGRYFGEVALLDDKPRACTVTARGEVLLLRIGACAFHKVIVKNLGGAISRGMSGYS